MSYDYTAKPPQSQSEEDFRTIVANITGIKKNDPIFDRIKEEDKRIIKSAKKAIDEAKVKGHNG